MLEFDWKGGGSKRREICDTYHILEDICKCNVCNKYFCPDCGLCDYLNSDGDFVNICRECK